MADESRERLVVVLGEVGQQLDRVEADDLLGVDRSP